MRNVIYAVLLMLLPLAAPAQVRFVTAEWDGYTNADGTGLYFELLDGALGTDGYAVTFRPWARAQSEMKAGVYDGIVGEDATQGHLLPRWPIDVNLMSVVFKRSVLPAWPGREALATHAVAWVRGYNVDAFARAEGIEIEHRQEVADLDTGLRMLDGDRFQVLVDFDGDVQEGMQRLGIDASGYVIETLDLQAGLVYVGFRNDAAGQALADRFDAGMQAMKDAGTLEALYRKYDRAESLRYVTPRK